MITQQLLKCLILIADIVIIIESIEKAPGNQRNKERLSQKEQPLFCLSGKRDSNSRPSAWEADALPTELFPPFIKSKVQSLKIPHIRSTL